MNLHDILVYLARGALTAFEVIIAELDFDDLKSLRYVSYEVSELIIPYLFHKLDQIFISTYGPDLDIAQAVLANPLLRCRVRKLVWDYSTIDPELLRYSWYGPRNTKIVGKEWQGLCAFISDHVRIHDSRFAVEVLEHAFCILQQPVSIHIINANQYVSPCPTRIYLSRWRNTRSATTAMFDSCTYCIRLLEPAVSSESWPREQAREDWTSEKSGKVSGQFRSLMYRGDPDHRPRAYWAVKASGDKVLSLLKAMTNASELRLSEFVVQLPFWSEYNQIEAWAWALERISPQLLGKLPFKFRNVKRMQFDLNDTRCDELIKSDRFCLEEHFKLVLGVCMELEDLNLRGIGWRVTNMLRGPYPNLKTLVIDTAQLESRSLIEFCRQHVGSLLLLEIRHSHLEGDSWPRFLIDVTNALISCTMSDSTSISRNETMKINLFTVTEQCDVTAAQMPAESRMHWPWNWEETATTDTPGKRTHGAVRMLLPRSLSFPPTWHCSHTLCDYVNSTSLLSPRKGCLRG